MPEKSENSPGANNQPDRGCVYLTPPEAAAFTRLAVQTLAKLRCEGGGPQYVKVGRRVVYPMSALRGWMDARVRSSTSDSGK
jgi:predicted DNA-binding transcriptional regulator AlpA